VPWLEGSLERVLWSSDRSGYAVVRLESEEGSKIAVGTLASLVAQPEGSFVALEGDWEDHPVHGPQFRATGLLDASPHSVAGLKIWLASAGVRGIGPALAERLVDHFGMSLVTVIRDAPERLREVGGVGKARIAAIREAWDADEGNRALMVLLRGLGLSQRLADKIRERYGDRARHVVTAQPFRLAEEIGGIGFRTADAVARTQGLPADDPARVRAAALHALEQASDQGHCFLPRVALIRAVEALGVPTEGLDDAVASAEADGRLAVERGAEPAADRVYASSLHLDETAIARDVAALAEQRREPPAAEAVAAAERWEEVALDPSQQEAVVSALSCGVSVITGGPGTGKTTLLRVLLRVLRERGAEVLLASPTGRAARRLEDATGIPASTIHRLLEFDPSTNRFRKCFSDPLEAEVVVIDEASMIDVPLMAALLDALPIDRDGVSLVLVGDVDQLPSVGPGQVLRDLIDSGVAPVARLRTLHRQAADSGLIPAARAVLEGRVPPSGEQTGAGDVFLLARPDAGDALQTLLKVVSERLAAIGYDPRADVQVLAPTRKGPLGTERLNAELQAALNPDGPGLQRGERTWRVGDRVICTRNRYDLEVFNGDVGRIAAADESGLVVEFDGRSVRWERDDLNHLDLAYAITVHKSQGSEYPAVVLALHDAHGIMLRRNLLYTAITRPRRFLCVVGSPRAWARAVRSTGGDERNTGLAERLREMRAEAG
jgi:exodeoxyribonuclease V alpha subunit